MKITHVLSHHGAVGIFNKQHCWCFRHRFLCLTPCPPPSARPSSCRLLREYLEFEFTAAMADKQLSFPLDVERVIDDVVLFCMLVGNDFLPGESQPGARQRGGNWVAAAQNG